MGQAELRGEEQIDRQHQQRLQTLMTSIKSSANRAQTDRTMMVVVECHIMIQSFVRAKSLGLPRGRKRISQESNSFVPSLAGCV